MASVAVKAEIAAPADAVWARIGDFTTWHTWIPRIVSTQMDPGDEAGAEGAVRQLTLSDGSVVRERLVLKDERRLAYEFPEGAPFPVSGYRAEVRVESGADGSTVYWSSTFDAAEDVVERVSATFTTIYTTFLGNLSDSFAPAS